jgi:hypothetical protein
VVILVLISCQRQVQLESVWEVEGDCLLHLSQQQLVLSPLFALPELRVFF